METQLAQTMQILSAIIQLLLILFTLTVFAIPVGLVAYKRGRSFWKYFLWSMIITPCIPIVIVLFLRPKRAVLEKREIATGESRRCPQCAELVRAAAKVCKYCGFKLEDQTVNPD